MITMDKVRHCWGEKPMVIEAAGESPRECLQLIVSYLMVNNYTMVSAVNISFDDGTFFATAYITGE